MDALLGLIYFSLIIILPIISHKRGNGWFGILIVSILFTPLAGGLMLLFSRKKKKQTPSSTAAETPSSSSDNAAETVKKKIELKGVGVYYGRERGKAFRKAKEDDLVELRLEPTNPYDPKAIAVHLEDNQLLGYLPRGSSIFYDRLSTGEKLEAVITDKFYLKTDSGPIQEITIFVFDE